MTTPTKTRWVNFKEIRARVSLKQVILDYYGITGLTEQGNKLVGPCPVHGGDSPRAFHADLEKNVWHCFSQCQGGGNQLDFVAKKEGLSIRDAALRLQDSFLGGTSESPPSARKASPARPTAGTFPHRHGAEGGAATPSSRASQASSPKASSTTPPATPHPDRSGGAQSWRETSDGEIRGHDATDATDAGDSERNPPLSLRLHLLSDHPHLLEERGLQEETCSAFGVGYCARGILAGCIAFPIQDEDGILVAYAGRRMKPDQIREWGKYRFPKGFRKELVLYHYDQAKEVMAEKGLILVEGFFTVLKLWELGFQNVVASMGCEVSPYQVELLARAPEVILLFDGDEAGRHGAEKVRAALTGKALVRVAHLPDGCEPEDLSTRHLRWLVGGLQVLDLEEVSFTPRKGTARTPYPSR